MITKQKIGGREATVVYLTMAFVPTTEAKAELIKIIYDDGEMKFAVPASTKEETGMKKFKDFINEDGAAVSAAPVNTAGGGGIAGIGVGPRRAGCEAQEAARDKAQAERNGCPCYSTQCEGRVRLYQWFRAWLYR
jgi:hypothetical protein